MVTPRRLASCSALVESAALVGLAAAAAADGGDPVALSGETSATAVQLYAPEDVTFDAAGNTYISEFGTSKTTGHRVNRVDSAGNLSVVAGTGIEGYGGEGGAAPPPPVGAPRGPPRRPPRARG